tara:strand:+ start:385 stop:846 length:462 start_codon:yes stop_codon:yes gene_type:complete
MSSEDLIFEVPMPPRGKGRPRHTVINGSVRVYTPKETRKWEQQVGTCGMGVRPEEIIEGPVRVDILAVMPRPKRLLRKKDPDGLIWCISKPDSDNIRKSVLDALKTWWRDDSQVVDGRTVKVYAERTGHPRVVVRVRGWNMDPNEEAKQAMEE